MAATWSANLYERESALVDGILLQKTLNRQKTLQDSFGVVHPIDAHTHERGLNPQRLEQIGSFDVGIRHRLRWVHIGEVHTDGKRSHQGEMLQTFYRKVFPIDACFQPPI